MRVSIRLSVMKVATGQLRWSSVSVVLTRRSGTAYMEVHCDVECLI